MGNWLSQANRGFLNGLFRYLASFIWNLITKGINPPFKSPPHTPHQNYQLHLSDNYQLKTNETTTTLNYVCTLFHGYEALGIPIHDFAPEFYEAVGQLLDGRDINTLELGYLEIED